MKFFKPQRIFISSFVLTVCILFFSCNGEIVENKASQTEVPPASIAATPQENVTDSQFPQIHSDNIEVKTFEVKDSTGKSKGWGYDIFVDSKRMIHQPIIPAISGNNAFKTEKDAQKTGALAAEKIKTTGSLPTLSVKELDSLGVIKNK